MPELPLWSGGAGLPSLLLGDAVVRPLGGAAVVFIPVPVKPAPPPLLLYGDEVLLSMLPAGGLAISGDGHTAAPAGSGAGTGDAGADGRGGAPCLSCCVP